GSGAGCGAGKQGEVAPQGVDKTHVVKTRGLATDIQIAAGEVVVIEPRSLPFGDGVETCRTQFPVDLLRGKAGLVGKILASDEVEQCGAGGAVPAEGGNDMLVADGGPGHPAQQYAGRVPVFLALVVADDAEHAGGGDSQLVAKFTDHGFHHRTLEGVAVLLAGGRRGKLCPHQLELDIRMSTGGYLAHQEGVNGVL